MVIFKVKVKRETKVKREKRETASICKVRVAKMRAVLSSVYLTLMKKRFSMK